MSQCASRFTDDNDEAPSPMQDVSNLFLSEIMELFKRGLEKKCNPKLIIQELDSLRFGWNMFGPEVYLKIIKAFILLLPLQEGPADLFSGFEHLMKYLGPVVQKYFHPEPFLKVFEEICAEVPALKSNGGLLLHYFYDNDLLYAYNVIQWFRYLDDKSPAKTDSVANFIEFLELPVDSDDSEDRIYVYRLKTNEK
uniref:CSON007559 protein n=2 Tax=Culicoides sonorensis TaxID=179676 RepID=A0A336M9S6_CULSO